MIRRETIKLTQTKKEEKYSGGVSLPSVDVSRRDSLAGAIYSPIQKMPLDTPPRIRFLKGFRGGILNDIPLTHRRYTPSSQFTSFNKNCKNSSQYYKITFFLCFQKLTYDIIEKRNAVLHFLAFRDVKFAFPFLPPQKSDNTPQSHKNPLNFNFVFFIALFLCLFSFSFPASGENPTLKASWYSIESLKQEGTFKKSKGVMANGKLFSDTALTCACNLYPLHTLLRVTCLANNKSIVVCVTDRISRRFGKTRIDLSKKAFEILSDGHLEKGLIEVVAMRIK